MWAPIPSLSGIQFLWRTPRTYPRLQLRLLTGPRRIPISVIDCARGVISVLLSNVYLHYVLDLWFERVVKSRLRGEACMVRYIDDFVLCFQFRADALRVQEALAKRLRRFGLTLEPAKTKLVEFGRYAHRHAGKRGHKRPETIHFLVLPCIALAIRKGTFGLDCLQRSHDCVAR